MDNARRAARPNCQIGASNRPGAGAQAFRLCPKGGHKCTLRLIGRHHVLSLYRHPKLIELASGQMIHAWPELPSGFRKSARLKDDETPPPMALDPRRGRFAIATGNQITVIEFDADLC